MSRIDQIITILEGELSGYTHVEGGIQNTFTLWRMNPPNTDVLSDEELFSLTIRAADEDALEEIVQSIRQLDSKYEDGYDGYTDELETDYPLSYQNIWKVFKRSLDSDTFNADATLSAPRIGIGVISGIGYEFRTLVEWENVFNLTNFVRAYFEFTPIQTLTKSVSITITKVTNPAYSTIVYLGYEESDLTYGTPVTLTDQDWEDGVELIAQMEDDPTAISVYEIKGEYEDTVTFQSGQTKQASYEAIEISVTTPAHPAATWPAPYTTDPMRFYIQGNWTSLIYFYPTIFDEFTTIGLRFRAYESVDAGYFPMNVYVKTYTNCFSSSFPLPNALEGELINDSLGSLIATDTITLTEWVAGEYYDFTIDTSLIEGYVMGNPLIILLQGGNGIQGVQAYTLPTLLFGAYQLQDTIATIEATNMRIVTNFVNTLYPFYLKTEIVEKYKTEAVCKLHGKWNNA